ncbi:MAG TPA: TIM barrel protein [Gaiellaceae bacterium]|nr:TIM barrel protein [Gaiellaceae bacterium]
MTGIRVANAPLSYGAFELTVGIFPNVPGPDELLAEMAAAGYAGTELGPPGYLGEGDELGRRLERHGLGLTGGWCPVHFSEPERWDDDFAELRRTLGLFEAAGATGARPVFGDGGSEARRANPGRGKDDPSLGLDAAGWRRFADGLARGQELAREHGFEPTFHPHTSTYVEAPAEIERLQELSDIGLLVDTGHLLVGGSDPVQALRDWGERVDYVHVKDARLGVVRGVIEDRANALEAWRRGIFCELGAGDVDLEGFFAELRRTGYEGWLCVEQDRIPREDEPLSEAAEAQVRNREWLRTQAGL